MFPPSGAQLQASHHLKPNSLHFVLGKPFLCSIIKFGRTRAFVCRHFLGVSSAPPLKTSSSRPERADHGRLHRGADRATLKPWFQKNPSLLSRNAIIAAPAGQVPD
jgi:hypothetical protein